MSKEMTPKEALQMIQDNLTPRVLGIFPVEFHIVKEALYRLEQLEKENQDLKELIKEYKRFKKLANQVIEKFQIGNKNLTEENEKCKKVIDILKNKANIRLHILKNTDGSKIYEIEFILGYYSTIHEITQQEYDLLKEVLESV